MNIKSFIKNKKELRDNFYRRVDSNPELEISNLLNYNGVPNKKPNSAFLGQYYSGKKRVVDFIINWRYRTYVIEYFGRLDLEDYKKKTEEKLKTLKVPKYLLIDIYPNEDFVKKIVHKIGFLRDEERQSTLLANYKFEQEKQYYRRLWDNYLTEELNKKLRTMRRNIINNSGLHWPNFWWYWLDINKEEYRNKGVGLYTKRWLKQDTHWKKLEAMEPQKKLTNY